MVNHYQICFANFFCILECLKLYYMPENYSGTKCPKCESINFEMVDDLPKDSQYKYSYLRCVSCKTFLAGFDFAPVGAAVADIYKYVREIKRHLGLPES